MSGFNEESKPVGSIGCLVVWSMLDSIEKRKGQSPISKIKSQKRSFIDSEPQRI